MGPCFLIMYINPLLAGIPVIQGFWNTVRADAKLDNSALSTSLALNSEKKKEKHIMVYNFEKFGQIC